MRILLLFLLIFFYVISNAQSPDNVLYAKTADIKDEGNKVIAKMTVIQGLRNEILLKNCSQKRDSMNRYITEFRFSRPNHLEARNITLILQFDKNFESVDFTTEGEIEAVQTTIADNKLGISFKAMRLGSDAMISIKVISRKKILTTITGIGGQL